MFWTAAWELDFQQAFSFERIAKKIRVHHLKAEKTHLYELDFWQKETKTLFWGCFCCFPTKWNFFFKKSSILSRCFPIRHPIFTYNFRKNLWTVLAKEKITDWSTVLLTDSSDFMGPLFDWRRMSKNFLPVSFFSLANRDFATVVLMKCLTKPLEWYE